MSDFLNSLVDMGRDIERGVNIASEIVGEDRDMNDQFVRNDRVIFERDIMMRTMLFDDEATARAADLSTEDGVRFMQMMTLFKNPGG